MDYARIRDRTRSRFNEVQLYLNYLTSLERPNEGASLELKIQRGLFFVQLYGALEKSVNDTVETTLLLISNQSVKNIHYATGFNVVAFSSQLRSIRDCGSRSFFMKAISLFEETRSSNINSINETVFARDLQNVWVKTIDEVVRSFGMNNFTVSGRERATIDEVVDKRNAIAHGRELASTVGEAHRVDVLRNKFDVVSEIANRLIDQLETFYQNQGFIKPVAKRYYI